MKALPIRSKENFEIVWAEESELIKIACQRINYEDWQEAYQETAIKLWLKWNIFQGQCELGTWLWRIATNEALMVLRRERRKAIIHQRVKPDTDGEDITARLAIQHAITEAAGKAELIEHLILGYNMREVAERRGEKLDCIKTRITRQKKRTKEAFSGILC